MTRKRAWLAPHFVQNAEMWHLYKEIALSAARFCVEDVRDSPGEKHMKFTRGLFI
jgi:hypothetical protein